MTDNIKEDFDYKDDDIYSIIEAEDGTIIHTLNGIAIAPLKKIKEIDK